MCAGRIARGWPAVEASVNARSLSRVITTGAAASAAGALAFAIAHRMLIAPIWTQAIVRSPIALLTGIATALTTNMGGPIPVVTAARAAWLFAAFLPISVAAGVALALTRQLIGSRS